MSRNGRRPTVGAEPNAGAGYAMPREVRVERGSAIAGERRVRADACVIGTGAGGAPVAKELAGQNALGVKRGADRLGWHGDFIYRNARGCVGSGVCNWGCPTSGKQHTGLTYVPLAWNAGATTFTGARARRIVVEGGRARRVEASTRGGGRLVVDCDRVIVAGGTIQTPLLLRRNGLGTASGHLGRNLSIHPATGVRALLDEDVNMASGVIQSYYIDEFAGEGIMFEGAAGPPDYIAMSFPFSGEQHRELMLRYRNLSQFGLMVSDASRGSVRERAGGFLIRYDLGRRELAAFRRGLELLCELYFAAGAKVVFPAVEGLGELRDGDLGPLRRHDIRPRDLTLLAFHPLGTARAAAHPEQGVVDEDLAVRGVEGVLVADGSAVPSSLGVNPQITIMALATRLAFQLLAAPPPLDEPEPESIAEPRVPRPHA